MSDTLNTCGCCEGVEPETPVSVANRPGLSALAYRVGTHARFKASMQAALARHQALRDLTTRNDDDPAIALLDGWALVLDVLAFYQERLANEGYLRTATERRSVLEMARRIGYELRPGVAASTFLAFTVEDAPTAPPAPLVQAGTQADSLPGQDERPQTFETLEAIEARAAWNAMAARQSVPIVPVLGTREIYLEGVANNLNPGDALLLVGARREKDPGSERWDVRRIKAVEIDRDRQVTRAVFERELGSRVPHVQPAEDPQVFVFRRRAALFGHNAPDWNAMPDEIRDRYESNPPQPPVDLDADWPGLTISGINDTDDTPGEIVYLDAAYPKIVPESWVVLSRPGYEELYRVVEAGEDARSRFTLSTKTTRLRLSGEGLLLRFGAFVRQVVVYAENEALALAEVPLTAPVQGNTVVLAGAVDGLTEGRLVMVSGVDFDTGEDAREVATLKKAEAFEGTTRLTFEANLLHRYRRDGVTFNANVARATHGKAVVGEVLGHGDGSAVFQAFTLKQKPLTYVAAATASGTESTLDVRVNGVLWEEVPSLYNLPSDAHAYITRLEDDGTVQLRFGDGRSGARLPTGSENVTAAYRTGSGLDGMVAARQISLLKTRPLGIKSVVNPLAPTGADDPERLEDARRNAPLTVLTLDRIVSLQDFEDFASAFAGIGKAQATLLWSGEHRLVHLTIAGAEGADIPAGSDTYRFLRDAIDNARHVDEQVAIDAYTPRTFDVAARVLVDPTYVAADVLAAVDAALRDAFSFSARNFAQSVTASEVLAVAQAVEGVVAVDLETLGGQDPFAASGQQRLPAATARLGSGAELLTIDPNAITLTEMTTP